MPLGIFSSLKRRPKPELVEALEPDAQVKARTSFYCHLDDGGDGFFRAYEKLRSAGNDFFNPLVHVYDDDPRVFPNDHKQHLIGYVAECLNLLWLRNPAEDFHHPPIASCQVGLRDEVEMDLEERPKDLFVAVADEFIAHDDWLEHFASPALSGVKPVRCRGKVLDGWNRLKIHSRESVLADFCFAWTACAACARPRIFDFGGISFSQTEDKLQHTLVNKQGVSQFGSEPRIILDIESLNRFRKGRSLQKAGLRPIGVYSPVSKRYEIFKRIDERLSHLRDEAIENMKTAKPAKPGKFTKEAMQELQSFMSKYFGH